MAKAENIPPFEFEGVTIESGTRATVDVPIASLYDHSQMTMPVHVIHGRRPGPCLFVCAALHGDEINGVEIIRQLLKRPALKRLRGTLLAIPVVNVYGFIQRTRYLPDRRDLNRFFPGTDGGSLAGNLASIFMNKIVSRAQYGIDLHTGSNFRTNLPQVRAQLDDEETERIAKAFSAPVILDAALRPGSLREAAETMGATVIVYEGGETLRFNDWAVNVGVQGIILTMRELGMLPESPRAKVTKKSSLSRKSIWARAPKSGVIETLTRLGAMVTKGQPLAMVADPFGKNEVPLPSPSDGIIIGQTILPLAHAGEALFHIAEFDDTDAAAARIRQDFDDEPA